MGCRQLFDQQVTFLYVRDLEASDAFYRGKLGLEMVLDQGSCRILRVSRDGFLGICQCRDERPSNPEGIIVTLVSRDVDGWHRDLTAKGVEFDSAPAENAIFNIYHCFLKDPDGHQLEIQRFNDPAWPQPD